MDKIKAVSESTIETVADLRRIIGISNTISLIEKCGGSFIYVPQMNTVLKNERDKAIYSDFNKGISYKQIALKYGISELTVRDIVKRERRNKNGRK